MISFSVNLELGNIQQRVEEAVGAGQKQLDQEVLKGSNYFIPKDTGELERSGVRASQIGKGKIIWDQPYARKLYYNPQYNFSKMQTQMHRAFGLKLQKPGSLVIGCA